VEQTTAAAFSALSGHVSKISADDTEKIGLVTSQAEQVIDFDAIENILN
jgi:BioD-like phosphotransacetylase family protein